MKLKTPTFSKLKMNIKYLLHKHQPKSFKEWKIKFESKFLINLKKWMNLEQIDFHLIPKYYEILFYWSFINYKREEQLIKFFEDKNFEVKHSNLKLDAIFKVDLIVKNDKFKYFFQLKNQKANLTDEERLNLIHFSNIKHAIPVLVYKLKNEYIFINLITNIRIFFS